MSNMVGQKCEVCGKTFYFYEAWAYQKRFKKKNEWFCSWHCLREREKEVEAERANRKEKKPLATLEEKRKKDAEDVKRQNQRSTEMRRKRVADRLARGVCQLCEKPLAPNRKLCPECLAYKAKYNASRRKKNEE